MSTDKDEDDEMASRIVPTGEMTSTVAQFQRDYVIAAAGRSEGGVIAMHPDTRRALAKFAADRQSEEPADVAPIVLARERVLGPMMLVKPSANRRPTPWDRFKTWLSKL